MKSGAPCGRDQCGFTLVELMIATAILGLVMAGLLGLLSASKIAYSRGSNTVDAQQNARVALERMAKEIREAGYHPRPPDTNTDPTTAPCPSTLYPAGGGTDAPCWKFHPIINQTPTAFTLQFDWNGDGAISASGKVTDATCPAAPCRGERVTYSLSGTTLTRQEVGIDPSPQEVATGISSLTIKYYKDPTAPGTYDGAAETSSRDLIRTVGIVITAKPGTDGASATMRDMIRLRLR